MTANSRFLAALRGENWRGPPPIWLMRQAGRYLPEYRALRENFPLRELFFTPELAAQITAMPIQRFGFDAAILFSDIAVVARALGLALDFCEGPVVTPRVTPEGVGALSFFPEALEPVWEAARLAKRELEVPLIGFCGGPFTVASYLVGGVAEALRWMDEVPEVFRTLLDKIETISHIHLDQQAKRGGDAVQIFDSWANVLPEEIFRSFYFPYIRRLVERREVPVLFFMRGAFAYLGDFVALPAALSLGSEGSLVEARAKTGQVLQGNLDPDLLFAPLSELRGKMRALLAPMREDPAFIFNLGHGVKPATPLEAVQVLVEVVREG